MSLLAIICHVVTNYIPSAKYTKKVFSGTGLCGFDTLTRRKGHKIVAVFFCQMLILPVRRGAPPHRKFRSFDLKMTYFVAFYGDNFNARHQLV